MFYCLNIENLGRSLEIKQKSRENGEYWGKRVDLHQNFEKEINKWRKMGNSKKKKVFYTNFKQKMRNLVKNRENGIIEVFYWLKCESVFYCLILRNLGRHLRNKTKIQEKWGILRKKTSRVNGECWGKRVDSYQKFEKEIKKIRKNGEKYGRIVFCTKFS